MMRALLKYGNNPREWKLDEIKEPVPGPGEVKIKVAFAGICGSDLHMYFGLPEGPEQYVPGHEFSGIIMEIGPGVTGLQAGDRVTAEHTFRICGTCQNCRAGRYNLCNERVSLGFEKNGAFAEYVIATAQFVHRLPDNVSLEAGAMMEPLACALHAVELIKPAPGEKALVVGPGPIGLLTVLCLQAYNCAVDIVGTPEDGLRLAKAVEIGAKVVDTQNPACLSAAYDLVAECSGSQGGVDTALNAVRKGGKYLQVGISTKPIPVNLDALIFKELTVQGSFCHHWPTWERALRFDSLGILSVKPLITEIVPLDQWQESFERLYHKEAIKILLQI